MQGLSLAPIRREIEAFKRKHARIIAAGCLKSAVTPIIERWEAAVAKKKPLPDPVEWVQEIGQAGFRLGPLRPRPCTNDGSTAT